MLRPACASRVGGEDEVGKKTVVNCEEFQVFGEVFIYGPSNKQTVSLVLQQTHHLYVCFLYVSAARFVLDRRDVSPRCFHV